MAIVTTKGTTSMWDTQRKIILMVWLSMRRCELRKTIAVIMTAKNTETISHIAGMRRALAIVTTQRTLIARNSMMTRVIMMVLLLRGLHQLTGKVSVTMPTMTTEKIIHTGRNKVTQTVTRQMPHMAEVTTINTMRPGNIQRRLILTMMLSKSPCKLLEMIMVTMPKMNLEKISHKVRRILALMIVTVLMTTITTEARMKRNKPMTMMALLTIERLRMPQMNMETFMSQIKLMINTAMKATMMLGGMPTNPFI
mmetsp:Transcript_9593/g.18089  ORF Transcript_9593/g.18089 Transcript_9593/m.18089 type:complete len:253 (-) Transcript_9593:249-1007(-)